MWYASMMDAIQHQTLISAAEQAIKNAQDVRAFHRKRSKPGDRPREVDIRHASEAVRRAMKPIRSEIGRIPYERDTEALRARHGELRAMSARLQAERRKLWKLRGRRDHTRPSKTKTPAKGPGS